MLQVQAIGTLFLFANYVGDEKTTQYKEELNTYTPTLFYTVKPRVGNNRQMVKKHLETGKKTQGIKCVEMMPFCCCMY